MAAKGSRRPAAMSYGQAMARLDEIVEGISEGEVDVDELAKAVREAAALVRTCREKLRDTQDEVGRALAEMEGAPEPTPARPVPKTAQPVLVIEEDSGESDPFASI